MQLLPGTLVVFDIFNLYRKFHDCKLHHNTYFVLEYSNYKLNIYTWKEFISKTNKYNSKQIRLMINKSTYNKLKKYEVHLRRGFKGGYVFGLYQKDFDELFEIYKQLGGTQRLKYSCSSCTLQLLKFLGKMYYEYDEKLKEKESK